jgi:hypothetical protein
MKLSRRNFAVTAFDADHLADKVVNDDGAIREHGATTRISSSAYRSSKKIGRTGKTIGAFVIPDHYPRYIRFASDRTARTL